MPIRLSVHHLDRIVVAVASGQVTLQDLEKFLHEMVEANVLSYRKIVDVAGSTPAVTPQELASHGALLRQVRRRLGTRPAPLAIVAHGADADLARLFTELTADERPAQVFRSIHDARGWLATQKFPERP